MSKTLRLLMVPVFIIMLTACSEEDVDLDPGSGGAGVEGGDDNAEEEMDTEDGD
ncbi:hypothetical protein ACFOU0_10770 [Salinicoccus sesuvii]|uniref:Uncharacterized protein n=1 Tax=Salinicoccus sesuvii TaxID=868281 RepID=A0ABV7N859_9STAP